MSKIKDAETQRFIFEIDRLTSNTPGLKRAQIAVSVGKKSQDFTDMVGGKKKLQRDFLDLVADKYPIDKNYVLTGERKSREYPTNTNFSSPVVEDYARSYGDEGDLRYTIKVQKECIDAQRARIEYLEAENFRLMEKIARLEGDKSIPGKRA